MMAPLGLGIFYQPQLKWIYGVFARPSPPIFSAERVNLLGLEVQTVYLLSLGISVLIMAGFAWVFTASKHGLAMRGTGFDQQGGQSVGGSGAEGFAMALAVSAGGSPGAGGGGGG